MRSKRPWKKYARIERVERNDGDVEFRSFCTEKPDSGRFATREEDERYRGQVVWKRGVFQSLTEAEADLDAWWAEYWPKQVKSRRDA